MNPTPRNPQVERISAAANPTLKSLRRLAQGSDAYREQGRLWLEGDHLLQAALARGVALQLALVSEQAFYEDAALQALALRATRVLVLPAALFGSLSELVTPVGIAGCVAWSRQSIEPGWPTVVLDRLRRWFSERVLSTGQVKDFAASLHTEAEVSTGLPFVGKLPARLTSAIRIGSTHRESLRNVVQKPAASSWPR